MTKRSFAILTLCTIANTALAGDVTEFCLDGEFDLGARLQGTSPAAGEYYPTQWCVVTEDDSQRVLYSATGKSNPDMDGDWAVAYLPPDTVRIVNRESPPDIEFHETNNADEARRVRRIDPRRLAQELAANPNGLDGVQVELDDNRVSVIKTVAALPLRGIVAVEWHWNWVDAAHPTLRLFLDNTLLFRATGRWRTFADDEAATLWTATAGAEPIAVAGDRWPARIKMQWLKQAENVYLVRGVRTGFQHLVVDTAQGLVIADAPAGWVEFHHIPPSDLVPGLGVSGLSQKLIDFLHDVLPDRPIAAVALTHFHDDHAGGARAFVAAGADVYAPERSVSDIQSGLNRSALPGERALPGPIKVTPVTSPVTLGKKPNRVRLLTLGAGPHADAMLGVWAMDKGIFFVSDVHVPQSDAHEPAAHRVVTECWFAAWASEQLPAQTNVINSHSAVVTPVSRLTAYLDSDACKALQAQ